MSTKFKIGDKVISICPDYGITKTGWKGVVLYIDKAVTAGIYVATNEQSTGFWVNPRDFKLLIEEDILFI